MEHLHNNATRPPPEVPSIYISNEFPLYENALSSFANLAFFSKSLKKTKDAIYRNRFSWRYFMLTVIATFMNRLYMYATSEEER